MRNHQVVRLYLGYLGNLGERVPELAGFWLLTILLQLPMQVNISSDRPCQTEALCVMSSWWLRTFILQILPYNLLPLYSIHDIGCTVQKH